MASDVELPEESEIRKQKELREKTHEELVQRLQEFQNLAKEVLEQDKK